MCEENIGVSEHPVGPGSEVSSGPLIVLAVPKSFVVFLTIGLSRFCCPFWSSLPFFLPLVQGGGRQDSTGQGSLDAGTLQSPQEGVIMHISRPHPRGPDSGSADRPRNLPV